jgi:hypothetical protein
MHPQACPLQGYHSSDWACAAADESDLAVTGTNEVPVDVSSKAAIITNTKLPRATVVIACTDRLPTRSFGLKRHILSSKTHLLQPTTSNFYSNIGAD